MKKIEINGITRLLLALFFCIPMLATAQKLPKTQEKGILLPPGAKVDGKSTEWNDQFQAYNGSAKIYYTLANDVDTFYIIIQVTDQLVIKKIIAGGIMLTTNATGNEKTKNSVAITYPIFDKTNRPNIILLNKLQFEDQTTSKASIDSFVNASNQQLVLKSKEIKIIGAKGIEDTLVSVYNHDGIKAASLFNNKTAYNFELAVPFKYLGLLPNTLASMNYNIKLNGSNTAEGNTVEDIPGGTRVVWEGKARISVADMQYIRFPTDFSGTYTFARK